MARLAREATSPDYLSTAGKEGKYLTFSLAHEEYGIGILKIKEIVGMVPVRPVPNTPEFVKGVINLRGKVIPVMDLRVRFGMDSVDSTGRTCIVVVEMAAEKGTLMIGLVVDEVSEVLSIKSDDIEDAPDVVSSLDTGYILGVAKIGNGVKILLDVERVIGGTEGESTVAAS